MPRVHHVMKARKDYPEDGIQKGDEYYWWQFRRSPIQRSKEYPNRKQLTRSDFLLELYDIEDTIAAMTEPDELDDILDQIETLRDECQERLDNMPEALQDTSDSGIMLQERIDGLDDWYGELDGVDRSIDDTEEDEDERNQEIIDEIQSIGHSL